MVVESFESRQLMASDTVAWSSELWAEGEGPNQAPSITQGAMVSLPTISEDDNFPAPAWRGVFIVGSLLRWAGYADADNTNSLFGSGIAITGLSGRGYLAYATELSGAWVRIPAVSETNALLLATNFYASTGMLYPQWICYVPDGANGESVQFTFRAWDLTSGTPSNRTDASQTITPSFADTTLNGGNTAFSAETATAAITVSSLNDAPTLASNAVVTYPRTNENFASTALTVHSILLTSGAQDVDANAKRGLAIFGTSGLGNWQYSTDGFLWNDIAGVSTTSSLLLDATSQLRYRPNLMRGERATLNFKAWDQTSGMASAGVVAAYGDTSIVGSTTAYSLNSGLALIDVTDVNDAPTIRNGAIVQLPGVSENFPSQSRTVDAILSASSWNDVDAGALKGLAVLNQSGRGDWQYSTDGVTWVDMGPTSATSALLLTSTTRVRYWPDGWNGETPRLSFKAWDLTSGTASTNSSRAYARVVSGGNFAYSLSNGLLSLQVSSFNDAPTAVYQILMIRDTDEDTPSEVVGVDSLLDQAQVNDVDFGAVKGLAVTEAYGDGTWQYSMDGFEWLSVGSVTPANALLLVPTAKLRFMPDQMNGTNAELRFRAWDRTSGTASTATTPAYGNATVTGGGTAYSEVDIPIILTVRNVNDAPRVNDNAQVTIPFGSFDAVTPPVLVSSLLASSGWSDVDRAASRGIAILGKSLTGTWQYSLDGINWVTVFNFSPTAALLLSPNAQIRCWLNLLGGGTPTLSFKAWDQTSGTASTPDLASFGDTTLSGGRTAYSLGTVVASVIMR